MLNQGQKSQTLSSLAHLSSLMDHFHVTLDSPAEDVALLLASLSSVLTFDSQRHLI